MIRERTHDRVHEVAKVLAVTFVFILLTLLLTTAAAKEDRSQSRTGPLTPPGTLPADIQQWASPIASQIVVADSQVPGWIDAKDDLSYTMDAWQAIEARRQGMLSTSYDIWSNTRLPASSDSWRFVAMAELKLCMSQYSEAEALLDRAMSIDPMNPVAKYLMGRVELENATLAYPWIERPQPNVIFVSTFAQERPVFSRELHQLAAMRNFLDASRLAWQLDANQPLMGVDFVLPTPGDIAMPVMSPTVGDLLQSADLEQFKADAHYQAAMILENRGAIGAAEQQLDFAATEGMMVSLDYVRLSQRWLEADYELAAERLLEKATRNLLRFSIQTLTSI